MKKEIPPALERDELSFKNENLQRVQSAYQEGKEILVDMSELNAEEEDIIFRSSKTAEDIREAQILKDKKVETWDTETTSFRVPPKNTGGNGFKNWAIGFFGGLISLGASAKGSKITPEDSLGKKPLTEKISKPSSDSTLPSKLEIYTRSKTKEGGTTPTGLSNSFLENDDHLTENDLIKIAQKYNFRLDNNKYFQEDLVDYLVKHHPEIIEDILKNYDQPLKGRNIDKNASLEERAEGLKDGLLGRRTRKMIEALLDKSEEINEETTTSQETQEEKEIPQPKGGYVINVRGDESGQKGVYYFFDNEADFMKATNAMGSYSSREVFGNGTGQATYNMNEDIFRSDYARDNEPLLGQAWLRNQKDQNKFLPVTLPKRKVAHFYEGLENNK